MGKYYAEAQGEDEAVAHAIEDHYRPKGPDDLVPSDPVSIAVALADKIDTLVGFWAIDEKPTGSKDPYALRRAALGVIRLILENGLRLNLVPLFVGHHRVIAGFDPAIHATASDQQTSKMDHRVKPGDDGAAADDLLSFFADRLKVQLRDQGARHDLVDAVFALEGQDDLLLIVRRVEALGKFLDTEDGKNLLAGYKRATNIIRIEEKKDSREYTGAPIRSFTSRMRKRRLASRSMPPRPRPTRAVETEDFEARDDRHGETCAPCRCLLRQGHSECRGQALRENRLKLLNEIRAATRAVADFSQIEG